MVSRGSAGLNDEENLIMEAWIVSWQQSGVKRNKKEGKI